MRGLRRPIFQRAEIVLVVSRFNEALTTALHSGAIQALVRAGVQRERIHTFWVPGALELPLATALLAKQLRPDALIALGCVIKGETPQYQAIGSAVLQALTQVSVASLIPVACGVIIAESVAQAHARTGGSQGNRGSEAAMAALDMIVLKQAICRRNRL